MRFQVTVWQLSLAVCAAAQGVDPVAKYAGKYEKDDRFKKAFGKFDVLREEALKIVCDRLGVGTVDARAIWFTIADALAPDAEKLVRYTEEPFQTSSPAAGVAEIVLRPEYIVNGTHDLRETVIHELTHAVMRLRMKRDDYARVPRWLREGIALWVAGQIESRVRALLRAPEYAAQPAGLLAGLDDKGGGLVRYGEYGLAIEYLVKAKGPAVIAELVARLERGEDARKAVAAVAGTTWEAFRDAAYAYAHKRIEELRPPQAETDAYLEIVRLDRERQYEQVMKASRAFLGEHPESLYRGDVLYWRGKAFRLRKQPAEAEKALKEVLTKHRAASGYVDEALYQLAFVRIEDRSFARARQPLRELLLDHPDTPLQDRAVYGLALCSLELSNRKEAKRLVAVFERSFSGSEVAAKVADLKKRLGRQ